MRSIDVGDNNIQRSQICRAIHDLLKRLPRGNLAGFHFHSTATPEARDIRFLWSSQPNLERINFSFRMCSPSLNDVVNQDGIWLRRLRCIKDISIDLGDTTDSELVEKFLTLLDGKKVQTATISWPFDGTANDYGQNKHIIEPILKWLPRDLEALALRWIPFNDSIKSDTYHFPTLKIIELRACYMASAFLDAFVRSPIERLTVRLHGDYRGDFTDGAWANLRDSVARMKSLKTLMVPNYLPSRQVKQLSGSPLVALPNLRILMLNFSPSEDSLEEAPWGLHPSTLNGNLVEVAVKLNDYPSEEFTRQCRVRLPHVH